MMSRAGVTEMQNLSAAPTPTQICDGEENSDSESYNEVDSTEFEAALGGEGPQSRCQQFSNACLYIVSHRYFEPVILILIIVNCIISISLASRSEEEDGWLEQVFGAIFLAEMLLKWCAWGLWVPKQDKSVKTIYESQLNVINMQQDPDDKEEERRAALAGRTVHITRKKKKQQGYFQDGWNILDFVIVLPSVIILVVPNAINLTSLRLLRILRPLRTIKRVEGMKLLAQTVVDAFPLVLEALFLILFIMIVFTILGLQIFRGVLHYRCYHPSIEIDYSLADLQCCSDKWDGYLQIVDDNFVLCDPTTGCTDGYLCKDLAPNPLPAGDFGSFDNFFYSFIQVFIISTSGAFSDTMYLIMDAYSVNCWIYFVGLSFIITFFVINLVLAVVDYVFNLRLASRTFIPNDVDHSKKHKGLNGYGSSAAILPSFAEGSNISSVPENRELGHDQARNISSVMAIGPADVEEPSMVVDSASVRTPWSPAPGQILQREARRMSSLTAELKESFSIQIAENLVENLLVRMDILKQSPQTIYCRSEFEKGWRNLTKYDEQDEDLEEMKLKWLRLYVNLDQNTLYDGATEEDLIHWFWETSDRYEDIDFKLKICEKLLILDEMERCEKQAWKDFQISKKHHVFAMQLWKHFDRELNLASTETNVGDAVMDDVLFDKGILGFHHGFDTDQRQRMYDAITKEKGGTVNYYLVYNWLQDRENYPDTKIFKLKLAAAMIEPADPEFVWKTRHGQYVKSTNAMVNSPWFKNVIFFLILLNTILLAAKWPGQSKELDDTIEAINSYFTWIFLAELVVRIFAKGFYGFMADPFNQFDAIIVIISLVDFLIFQYVGFNNQENSLSFLTALRALRLLRVFRLLQRFKSCRVVLQVILNVTIEVFFLLGILFIFDFMFASLGITLFRNKLTDDTFDDRDKPRWHFDDFIWSMITVFQILANDSWHVLLYDFAQVANIYLTFGYFALVVVFSTAVFFPLFISLLLSQIGIGLSSTISRLLAKKEKQRRKHNRMYEMHGLSFRIFSAENKLRKFCHALVNSVYFQSWTSALIVLNILHMFYNSDDIVNRDLNNNFLIWDAVLQTYMLLEILMQMIALGVRKRGFDSADPRLQDKVGVERDTLLLERKKEYPFDDLIADESESNKFIKEFMIKVRPIKVVQDPSPQITVKTVLFELEATPTELNEFLHKVKKKGLKLPSFPSMITRQTVFESDKHYENPNAFFARKWNIFDTILVSLSFMCITIPHSEVAAFLRCFRPLRLIGRVRKVNVVFISLARAVPPVINTLIFGVLFWFIIAVVGMHLFQDRWNWCRPTDDAWEDREQIAGILDFMTFESFGNMTSYYKYNVDRNACPTGDAGGKYFTWYQPEFNYDHIVQAYHTTLYLSTVSGFADIMYLGVDAPTQKYDHQYYNRSPIMGMYFIFAVIVGGFFTINLMSSVVINTFNSIREEKQSAILTGKQREWVEKSTMVSLVPRRIKKEHPSCFLRKACFDLCEKLWFEYTILCAILINTLSFAMVSYGMSDGWKRALESIEFMFVILFTCEAILKILGYTFPQYIEDHWNKFDFALVWIGIFGWILRNEPYIQNGPSLTMLRFFRVARLFRLVQRMSTLKMLFVTIIISIPFVWNIAMFILVCMTVFAFLGLLLFGNLDRHGSSVLSDKVNFDDSFAAYLLLYRLAQRDGWGAVYEAFVTAVGNDESYKYAEYISPQVICSTFFFPFFFFVCVCFFDLFIAVVLEMFAQNLNRQQDLNKLKKEGIGEWQQAWYDVDSKKEGLGQVTGTQFVEILLNTPRKIGFAKRYKVVKRRRTSRKRESSSLNSITARTHPRLARLQSAKKATVGMTHQDLKKYWKAAWLKFFYFKFELQINDEKQWMVSYEDALFGISESMNRENLQPLMDSVEERGKPRKKPAWRWFIEHYLPEHMFYGTPDFMHEFKKEERNDLFEFLKQWTFIHRQELVPEDSPHEHDIKLHYLLREPVLNQEKDSRYKYDFLFKECVENLLNDPKFNKLIEHVVSAPHRKEELILWYFNRNEQYGENVKDSNFAAVGIDGLTSENFDYEDDDFCGDDHDETDSTRPPTFRGPVSQSVFSESVIPPTPPVQSEEVDEFDKWTGVGGHVYKKKNNDYMSKFASAPVGDSDQLPPTNPSANKQAQYNDPTRLTKQVYRPPIRTQTEPDNIHIPVSNPAELTMRPIQSSSMHVSPFRTKE